MQPSRAMPGKFLSIKFVAGNKPATWRSAVLSLTSVLVVGRDHFDSVFLIKMSVSARDKRLQCLPRTPSVSTRILVAPESQI